MDNLKKIGEQVHRAIMDGVEPTDDIAKQIVGILNVGKNEKVVYVNSSNVRVNNNTVISSELLQLAKQYSRREQN